MTDNGNNERWEVKSSQCHIDLNRFLFFAVFSFFVSILTGCVSSNNTGSVDAPPVSPDIRKAELLNAINNENKFNDPDAHYELGQIYHSEGQWSNAEWYYERAISFDPVYWPAKAAMVKLFIDNKEPAKAKTHADIYMNEVSNSADQSLKLASAFQNKGLNEYALAAYQQAMSIEPGSAKVHKQIGYYYLSRNDKVKAEEHFVLSYRFDSNQPEVARELGRLGVEIRIPQNPAQGSSSNP